MERKFIPTLTVSNGYTYLKLQGVIDEDNYLASLLSQIQGRLLLIEMAEVERINSCGVRDWVNWLNQIQALGIQIILIKCSPPVINQANMVTNFVSDAFIHSFYAPYSHPDTGEEHDILLFTEDLRQSNPVQVPKIFSDDGMEMEFEEFAESYFAFIHDPRILNYQMAEDIRAVVQYFAPPGAPTKAPAVEPQRVEEPPPAAAPKRPMQKTPHVSIPTPQPQIRHAQPPIPHQPANTISPPPSASEIDFNQPVSASPRNLPPARPSIAGISAARPSATPKSIQEQQEQARQQAIQEQNRLQQEQARQQAIQEQSYQNPHISQQHMSMSQPHQQMPMHSATHSMVQDPRSRDPYRNQSASKKTMMKLIGVIIVLLVILLVLLIVIKFL